MTDDSLWIDGPDVFANAAPARKTRKARKAEAEQAERFIGCPLWWFRVVYPLLRGKGELAAALALWRLRSIRKSRTVEISNVGVLAEVGADRQAKYRMLKRLGMAGLVTVRRRNKRALEVTFSRRRRAV